MAIVHNSCCIRSIEGHGPVEEPTPGLLHNAHVCVARAPSISQSNCEPPAVGGHRIVVDVVDAKRIGPVRPLFSVSTVGGRHRDRTPSATIPSRREIRSLSARISRRHD